MIPALNEWLPVMNVSPCRCSLDPHTFGVQGQRPSSSPRTTASERTRRRRAWASCDRRSSPTARPRLATPRRCLTALQACCSCAGHTPRRWGCPRSPPFAATPSWAWSPTSWVRAVTGERTHVRCVWIVRSVGPVTFIFAQSSVVFRRGCRSGQGWVRTCRASPLCRRCGRNGLGWLVLHGPSRTAEYRSCQAWGVTCLGR